MGFNSGFKGLITMIEEWKEGCDRRKIVRKVTTCAYYLCKVIHYKSQ